MKGFFIGCFNNQTNIGLFTQDSFLYPAQFTLPFKVNNSGDPIPGEEIDLTHVPSQQLAGLVVFPQQARFTVGAYYMYVILPLFSGK